MAQNFFELELDDCDSLKDWDQGNDSDNLSLNLTGQYQGDGCLNLDLGTENGSGIAYYLNQYIGTKNISIYDHIKFNMYLSDAHFTAMLGGSARVGTNSSNYNYWNLTVGQLTAVANATAGNWREITLDLNNTNTSGTVDLKNINYLYLTLAANSAIGISHGSGNLRLDNWRAVKNFDSKYDVELDGQGYQLLQQDGSYNRANQPYAVDRYSTGDITYSNFDVYQYKVNTDWSGGFNDEFGLSENTFWSGKGLDISEVGKIKNSIALTYVSAVANTGIVTAIQEYKQSAFFGITAGVASAHIYSWIGSGNTLTLQYSVARSAIQDMIVFQNNLWVSVGEPYTTPNQMAMFDGTTWSAVNQSAGFMAELGDSLYTMDQASRMRSFDGSTWTTEFTHTGWYGHRMVTWREKIWYLASTGDPRFTRQERCALYSYDGVDRLLIQEFDGWCKNSIAVYNNKLYFVVNGILKSYDGENILDELDITVRYPNYLALDIYSLVSDLGSGIQSIGNKLYLVQNSASASTASQVLINNGNGFYPGFFGDNQNNTVHITALGSMTIAGEKRLMWGTTSGTVAYQTVTGESQPFYNGYFDSSWIDADLFSIDKIFKSIQIFLNPLSINSGDIYIEYIVDNEDDSYSILNNINHSYNSGTTFAEFDFPPNTVGKKLRYRIIMAGGPVAENVYGSSENVAITDVGIKYLLAPNTKHKWNLRVMLPNNMLLNSGIRDQDNGETLANTLWDSRIKKEVLQYKDIDNQIYNVIINDVQIQGPYNVQTGRESLGTNPEYVASIELLEG